MAAHSEVFNNRGTWLSGKSLVINFMLLLASKKLARSSLEDTELFFRLFNHLPGRIEDSLFELTGRHRRETFFLGECGLSGLVGLCVPCGKPPTTRARLFPPPLPSLPYCTHCVRNSPGSSLPCGTIFFCPSQRSNRRSGPRVHSNSCLKGGHVIHVPTKDFLFFWQGPLRQSIPSRACLPFSPSIMLFIEMKELIPSSGERKARGIWRLKSSPCRTAAWTGTA